MTYQHKIDHMKTDVKLFDRLFDEYKKLNPSVQIIHQLFQSQNETIYNDHIAFRSFNHSDININALAKPFLERDYKEKGNYRFEQKKLIAKHYENENNPMAPKIFISELCIEELSPKSITLIEEHILKKIQNIPPTEELLFAGTLWGEPEYSVYQTLLEESEYAAWLYAFGFRANHFTVFVNTLNSFNSLEEVNQFLKTNGHQLNSSGGEIKGTPDLFLEQSSTLADIVDIKFKEGTHKIPACYYEFARRYPLSDGKLFNGFIAKSADKIFESTNYRKD